MAPQAGGSALRTAPGRDPHHSELRFGGAEGRKGRGYPDGAGLSCCRVTGTHTRDAAVATWLPQDCWGGESRGTAVWMVSVGAAFKTATDSWRGRKKEAVINIHMAAAGDGGVPMVVLQKQLKSLYKLCVSTECFSSL